ncbi:flagella basal body P-ring formation protein FlgA [Sphingopyxis granuli]|jgi:flagella basal body P-ring formation protein FlgA|uniref:flagella basal body P-ring formation protein FlgA n=1 Tax=Sphingopyxis granuli TaxID=267128 RepID=UPI00082E685C|nr:flagella basal body P-ring formation protein FlgA [Sphingopyxis granuli]QUM72670.1 flagella basal body P-ring formation protein FlgA [Sphingopyxis granuli]
MQGKTMAGLALALAAIPAASAQQATEDWQTIDTLTAMVANAMGRSAAPIDRRIKLARCPEQASITAIDSQTLAVRCPSLGWRLRVPMTGPAGAMPVTAQSARPAAAAPAIRRGDHVRVSIDTESFSIAYTAVAAEDGRVGEAIALRGTDAKSMLSAVVTGPGRARLAD